VAHIGDIGDLRFHRSRALVISATGKTREAFFTKQHSEGVDANRVARGSEFPLHVIDREIAFPHGDRQITDAVASGGGLRSTLRLAEEGSALLGIVAELMAKDAEGAWGVTKTAGDVAGGLVVDEEGAESLVLALNGELWGQEEFIIRLGDYLIYSTGLHTMIVLQKHATVNMFWIAGSNEWLLCRQVRPAAYMASETKAGV